jgi:glycosyltransferase involved in cell wall biosynthesis
VFFAHNVEHQIWQRLALVERRWWRRLPLEFETRKLRRCEMAVIRRAARTAAVSDADRTVFVRDVPGAMVDVIPTGVDTSYFVPATSAEQPGRLVFSGSMDWYPNEDAVLDFASHVWPRLRAVRPDLTLTVVGRNPGPRVVEAGRTAGFEVTGTVDDVRPHVGAAEVYVVPLRVGGGTRIKIFEALAMQKAVVSTTVGAEGLGLVPGRHFVAADGHDAFARAVLDLLDRPDRRRLIAAAGRELVEEHFSWRQVSRDFEACLERAVQDHAVRALHTQRRLAVS